jgi:ArsR family transcriptional regulator
MMGMRELTRLLKAAGDESRLRILNMLRQRPLCVCEIADVLGLAQSTVSRHLKLLEDCGLLVRSKDGLWVEYALALPPQGSVRNHLLGLVDGALRGSEAVRADEEKTRTVDRHVLCGRSSP